MTSTGEAILFWVLAPVAVAGALGLIFARKAVHAALGMALTMIVLGIFYLAQGADFLGVIQIFVYTGAVMMLFLFVVMLVGVDSSDSVVETLKGQRAATAVLSLGLGALLVGAIGRITVGDAPADKLDAINSETGNVSGVAELIFGRYVWVFEATSALLITAALAAMVLAHRERLGAARAGGFDLSGHLPRFVAFRAFPASGGEAPRLAPRDGGGAGASAGAAYLERPWRGDRSRARTVRRCCARAQGRAGKLPPRSHSRRRGSGGDRRGPRRGRGHGQALESMPDPDVALIFSCMSRKSVLGPRFAEECQASFARLPAGLPKCGFYTFGELSPVQGVTMHHESTYTIVLLKALS